ncbi:MAG: nitroreductase family protein [Xanthomonadales bacterium]|nr:nitroreductase family protein [Gammaproteobacteria bacterium]MBT8050326.1 nitroreductase family protein [Gammaproteobacteria bacterium]NNJ79893.1 nitroreductase family protein [Xanthomonadales bacterium]NNL04189.1 nitroreductase family protein [Xanthomonadales bacterium]
MTDHPQQSLVFEGKSQEEMLAAARAFYEEVKTRRSVRDFSAKPVERAVIENALLAAGTAPNGANRQPWYFVAVAENDLKRKIREAAEREERAFYEHRAGKEWLEALAPLGTDHRKPFLETAPWLIVVFLRKFSYDDQGRKLKNYYTAESVGIACGFLITALHQAGLATLTHTPSPMKFLNEVLDRPGDERAYMVIVAGHPADGATVPIIDKKSLEEIAEFRE